MGVRFLLGEEPLQFGRRRTAVCLAESELDTTKRLLKGYLAHKKQRASGSLQYGYA